MKTALVTGAGSGIGRATAIALGNSGYALALVGRRREMLQETAELTGAPETVILTADLTNAQEATGVVEAAEAALGGLGVLVNNAGGGSVVPISAMTPRVWDAALALNASSAAYCTMAVWKRMTAKGGKEGGGVIVNIASMAVYDPFDGFFAYGAGKGAMALMTVSTAKEGGPHGITAYCICPGAVETALLRSAFGVETIPADETLNPESVAAVVLACVRGERAGDSGRTIAVLPRSAQAWWREWTVTHPGGWIGMEPVWGA